MGPRLRPLGGLTVNRVWPTARRRLIGPFIFLDHLQPVELPPGVGLDVPPHPHIGLATVTYLFAGELMHSDSLGFRQPIRPGELNWMTAGRGITHAERSTDAERRGASRIHGVQSWVALPAAAEDDEPAFEHYAADSLPRLERAGVSMRLIAGAAFGQRSPVRTRSELFYLDARLDAGASLVLPAALGQRAVYIVDGELGIGGEAFAAGRIVVLHDGADVEIVAVAGTHCMLLGGAPLAGERHIWWNFVSSRAESIEAAKRDWQAGRFPPVPGDPERMPLPA